jgi:hypothetical protein
VMNGRGGIHLDESDTHENTRDFGDFGERVWCRFGRVIYSVKGPGVSRRRCQGGGVKEGEGCKGACVK